MDIETCPPQEPFTKTVAKSFILSIASTAGMFGGMAIVGSVITASQRRRRAREAQETPSES